MLDGFSYRDLIDLDDNRVKFFLELPVGKSWYLFYSRPVR
jgi:hypothetical protein